MVVVVVGCATDIVHFDIKAENILLDPLDENVSDAEFYHPSNPDALPFTICLADFGECDVRTRRHTIEGNVSAHTGVASGCVILDLPGAQG